MPIQTNVNHEKNTYSYSVSWGPFRAKGDGSLNHDLKNLDNIIGYLDAPNNVNGKGIIAKLKDSHSTISVRLMRLWNFVFGDHEWYNENRVRKIVKNYSQLRANGKVPNHSKKVLAAFDALAKIKKGNGTYADKISRDSLKEYPALDAIKALYAQLPEMPEARALAIKTIQTIGALALLSLQKTIKASVAKTFGNVSHPLLGLTFNVAAQLLEAAAKDLKADKAESGKNPAPQPAKKARKRSQSVG